MQNVRERREAEERAAHENQHHTFYTIMIIALVIACLALIYGLVATSTGAVIRRSFNQQFNDLYQQLRQNQPTTVQPPEDVESAMS